MTHGNADRLALDVARQIHRNAGAKQTYLFGSRAGGDHLPISDIDLLVITDRARPEGWLNDLRRQARGSQKTRLPQASGVDVAASGVMAGAEVAVGVSGRAAAVAPDSAVGWSVAACP